MRRRTKKQIAEALGVHPATMRRWNSGELPTPAWVPLALRGLEERERDSDVACTYTLIERGGSWYWRVVCGAEHAAGAEPTRDAARAKLRTVMGWDE